MHENQNIEYKRIGKDDYLKWVCAFANAQGGTLYIGIEDSAFREAGLRPPTFETQCGGVVVTIYRHGEIQESVQESAQESVQESA